MHSFFFSSRRRHTRYWRDWSSDVCSSDLQDWHAGVVENAVKSQSPKMKVEKIQSGQRAGQVLATYAVPIDAEEVTGEQGTAVVFSEFFIESDIENVDAALDRKDRKSTRLNSSHANISYADFCLKIKKDSHRPRRFAVLAGEEEGVDDHGGMIVGDDWFGTPDHVGRQHGADQWRGGLGRVQDLAR